MKKTVFIIALIGFGLVSLLQRSYATTKESHADYAAMEIRECNSCHKSEGIAPNHDADFLRGHRVLAGRGGSNCSQCHAQAWCLDCHQGGLLDGDRADRENFGRDSHPRSHRSDFINIHPVKALDNPQQCYRCHDQKYCTACHSRFPAGSLRIRSHLRSGDTQTFLWTSEHAAEARRNLQSCQTCHADGDVCLRCHSATKGARVNPHPRGFKTGNRNSRTCRVCH